MYRFNFLNKINQEKLEAKKRDRFIKMIFVSTSACIVMLLVVLFIRYLNIGSTYTDAQNYQKRISEKSEELRNKDFFKYKNIESVYNLNLKRRNITAILNTIEAALDSSLILNNFIINANTMDLKFISRTSVSKSQLMSRMNILKNQINEDLIAMNYVDEKKPLDLLRGPDIKTSYEEYQYWIFDFSVQFKSNIQKDKPKKSSENENKEIK